MPDSLKAIEKEMEKKDKRIKKLEGENEKLRDLVSNDESTSDNQTERKPSKKTENKESSEGEFSGAELFIEAYKRNEL